MASGNCWRSSLSRFSGPTSSCSSLCETGGSGCRIVFNLALLAFFKYKLLFLDPVSPSLVDFAPLDFLLKLPLPIGISFFVFHNISLLVDLTRQKGAPPTLTGVFL